MGFGGSASSMNASIKANAELRKRKRAPFSKVEELLSNSDYNATALSKYENKKIRKEKLDKIKKEFYAKINRTSLPLSLS